MPMKVSVVVPVFNPGRHFAYCVDSLLGQSLPADEFEAIFIDDGSTDGTDRILDELAAAHPNFSVIHIPNSGWPGRPRNVGTDAATGRYVHYLDNDDALGPEALERLYDFAEANASDVVFGRYAGHRRAVAREVFRETRPDVVDHLLLADTLTPHKMFRREFLDRHRLRFPEGRRRLEDQVFVSHAFLAAERISVLSDYVCYYHIRRDDASNAAFGRFVPSGYFGNVEEVMDVVEAHTVPGRDRDAYLRRCLRREMLGRLNSRTFLAFDADFQCELFDVVYKLDHARIPPHVRESLPPTDRLRAKLLHGRAVDALMAYGEHIAGVRGSAKLTSAAWRDGILDLGFDLRLITASGDAMPFIDHEQQLFLDVPADLVADGVVSWDDRAVGDRADRARVDLVVRYRSDSAEFFASTDVTTARSAVGAGRVAMTYSGHARLDPARWAGGAPLWAGIWDVFLRVSTCGFDKEVRLGGRRAPGVEAGLIRAQFRSVDTFVRPYWTSGYDNLSLNVGPVASAPKSSLAPGPADVSVGPTGWPIVRLPFEAHAPATDAIRLRFTGLVSGRVMELPAEPSDNWSVTVAAGGVGPLRRPRFGQWRLAIVVAGRAIDTGVLVSVSVLRRVSVRIYRKPRSPAARLAAAARRTRSRAVRTLRPHRRA
jgi:glycosyltransferase involved in cell wall biosynthesis